MNCPECGERPVGFFHSFRLGGLNFTNRTKGYFKCRNCGTILRQKRRSNLFPTFKKGFWVAYPLLIILFATFAGYVLSYLGESGTEIWQIFAYLGAGAAVTLGISDELRYRYWEIEKSKLNNQNRPVKKLTARGWAIFLFFTICSASLFLGAQWYIDLSKIQLTTYMAGYVFLLISVLAGSAYIIKKFSIAEVDM